MRQFMGCSPCNFIKDTLVYYVPFVNVAAFAHTEMVFQSAFFTSINSANDWAEVAKKATPLNSTRDSVYKHYRRGAITHTVAGISCIAYNILFPTAPNIPTAVPVAL